MATKRTEAQQKAEQAYDAKRKGQARLPSAYLDAEQDALSDRVAVRYKTKKDAIIDGLRVLDREQTKTAE